MKSRNRRPTFLQFADVSLMTEVAPFDSANAAPGYVRPAPGRTIINTIGQRSIPLRSLKPKYCGPLLAEPCCVWSTYILLARLNQSFYRSRLLTPLELGVVLISRLLKTGVCVSSNSYTILPRHIYLYQCVYQNKRSKNK